MIPLTDQVETVAFLERCAVPERSVVYRDDELLIVDRSSYDSTPPGPSGLLIECRSPAVRVALESALRAASARAVHLVLAKGVTPRERTVARRRPNAHEAVARGALVRRIARA